MQAKQWIANRIKRRLRSLGMNRSDLANLMSTQHSTVTRWLNGNHNFTIETIEQIEIALSFNLFAYDQHEDTIQPCSPCIVGDILNFKK